ncbi:hypothetical protein OsJ_26129 [Oryza sativa Japonica Group]|uniref:Uncharacterized protein n=3 Tax=Oryza TaxID=4527 RepID=A3BPV7_ORYSJ|nr:hypothetical protein OsJ_26129 [Oryza sativa Japonica Group]
MCEVDLEEENAVDLDDDIVLGDGELVGDGDGLDLERVDVGDAVDDGDEHVHPAAERLVVLADQRSTTIAFFSGTVVVTPKFTGGVLGASHMRVEAAAVAELREWEKTRSWIAGPAEDRRRRKGIAMVATTAREDEGVSGRRNCRLVAFWKAW